MKHYVLDTSALLTLRDDEAGADRVAELLAMAGNRKVRCKDPEFVQLPLEMECLPFK
ncbi:MAG: hypothetical protein LDL19_04395 [Thiobacillus sp.]|nr:hypothetical protein [Thiobacillus sp.]